MKLYSRYFLLLLIFVLSLVACAGTKSSHVSQKYFTINDATIQRTMPGRREGAISTQYRFVITWNSNERPESFYWKSIDVWMNCKVYRLHGIKDNDGEEVNLDDIRKGDILSLVPFQGGKFPIPSVKNAALNNLIIFKTNKSNWQSIIVHDFRKLPDLIMP